MSNLVEALERYNRKERYWLLREALGPSALSSDFRKKLGDVLRRPDYPDIAVPPTAWWAIDYHVDWLFGALSAIRIGERHEAQSNADNLITGTQEDFDLVIAFDRTLIVIEAKAGQRWTTEQMRRKLIRLNALSQYNDNLSEPIALFFVLTSPTPPPVHVMDASVVPAALRNNQQLFWMPLGFGTSKLVAVTRCTADGRRAANGGFWRTREVSRKQL